MNWVKIKQFFKAQLSAFIGGMVDYGVMLLCKEVFGFSVTNAIRVSGTVGAVVNFSINRFWTFKDSKNSTPIGNQLWKFVIVVIGSIFLKSHGTPILSEITGIDYKITRLMIELIVSLGFNYPLQKYWVFKK
ncbi:GtrA family protein [Sphingobacterium hungaricum]|uniref:GtrA family protein n=1 Tax=Sphingobacterium hungaricum TaxID=2082723 RepID=A0A928UYB5_9SPHI|nr:GtrA family protein [Sphingobacterium hungaricum]MBE8713615.1 GtrA family protein [Sphingobacterium hungaricum]